MDQGKQKDKDTNSYGIKWGKIEKSCLGNVQDQILVMEIVRNFFLKFGVSVLHFIFFAIDREPNAFLDKLRTLLKVSRKAGKGSRFHKE